MAKEKIVRRAVTAWTPDGSPVMEIYSVRREGSKLILDGKALGSMTMDVVVDADEVAQNLGILLKKETFGFAWRVVKAAIKGKFFKPKN